MITSRTTWDAESTCQLIDHMGNDASIVNAARVSFMKSIMGNLQDKDEKLLKYLAEHNHWSPFGS
jgi:thymidylate synthase (FAD)